MTNEHGARDEDLLEWFEALCDLPPDAMEDRLLEVPAALRPQVRAMLESDRRADLLDASAVQWALAHDVAADGSVPPARRELPATLGPYRRLSALGEGGMGRVFVAEQDSPRRRVALKVLHTEGADGGRRAMAEAQALADVRDVHIPHVIEVGQQDGIAYLAMELVHGEPLRRWAGGRSLREIVALVARVARGVGAAHAAGVLHRDIKPSNVLVEPGGVPRLLDFGLAGDAGGGVAGTLPYLAPEQLDGAPASERTDVFALGVTLVEVVCGGRPYPSAEHPSLAAERRARANPVGSPASRGIGDADLDAVVRMALAPAPERYGSAVDLAADLEAWLTDRPLRAAPSGPVGRVRLWARRQQRLLVSVGATAALLGTAGAGVLGGLWAHQRWVEADTLRVSRERLDALGPSLQAQVDAGHPERATEILESFVTEASVIGAGLVAEAWVRHHEMLQTAGDHAGARDALARAYLGATRAERPAVRQVIARSLARERQWTALLATLEDDRSAEAGALRARALVALRHQDDPEARVGARLAGVLEALRPARRTPYRPMWIESRSAAPGGVLLAEQDADRLVWLAADPALTVRQVTPLPPVRHGFGQPLLVWEDNPVLVGLPAAGGPLEGWSFDGTLASLGVVAEETAFPGDAALADVDGDGIRELYTGSLYPTRALWRADRVPGGWRATAALAAGPSLGSDILQLLPTDLDGDGADELLVTTGLWAGHDLRVYGMGADGLVLRQRIRFQGAPVAAVLDGPSGRWLVVAVGPLTDPETLGIAGDRRPTGLHVFRVGADGALSPALHVTPPMGPHAVGHVVPGDFDGDGRPEVAVHLRADVGHLWMVGLEERDGVVRAESYLVLETEPFAALDLDRDGADELLVRLPDDDFHMWVLGDGADRLPHVVERTPAEAHETAAIQDLLRYGFELETAGVLRSQAEARGTGGAAADDLATAAALMARQGRPVEAMRLYDEALQRSDRPAWRARRDEAAARAHRTTPADWQVDGVGAAALVGIERPGTLRVTPEGLRVDAIGADGVLATWDLDPAPGGPGMEVELTVHALEPGVTLLFELLDADARVLQQLSVHAWGGNLRMDQLTRCRDLASSQGAETGSTLTRDPGDVRHALFVHRSGGESRCQVERPGGEHAVVQPVSEVPVTPSTLRIRVAHEPQIPAGQVVATIHEVAVWGGTAREVQDPAWVRHWMHGRLDAALADATDPVDRVGLQVALGAWQEALAELGTLDLDAPPVRALVLRGLKRDAGSWIPLVREGAPERFGPLYAEAWTESIATERTPAVLASIAHPFVDALDPADPRVRRLLARRADLLASEGEPARARRVYARLLPVVTGADAVDVRLALARLLVADGEPDVARRLCAEARAMDVLLRAEDAVLDDPVLRGVCP